MSRTPPLAGKRALVTGASGALGAAIARRLARDGASVLLHANTRADAVRMLADEITAAGGSATPSVFDLTSDDATRSACERMLDDGGAVQIIVNNAGVHDDAVFAALRAEQWHHVIDVSLHGFFRVTQPLLLPMLRTRWGRIVNISSLTALIGNRALSLEVASRGVTVNAVAPGIITSPMADAAFDAQKITQLVPAGRAGTPEEVAALVAFLAGPEAGYITGQIISINGGVA
jgi:3-oxoacyl-[acyl-carrier protein] reductase